MKLFLEKSIAKSFFSYFSSINISDERFKKFDDTNQLIRELDLTKMKNKSILIKGSRSIGLEKLIN